VVENTSDGMDMYNLVLRKFKQIHYKQEQDRFFPVYDSETLGNSKVGYKKICCLQVNFTYDIFLRRYWKELCHIEV